jgi:hypothetical protein
MLKLLVAKLKKVQCKLPFNTVSYLVPNK